MMSQVFERSNDLGRMRPNLHKHTHTLSPVPAYLKSLLGSEVQRSHPHYLHAVICLEMRAHNIVCIMCSRDGPHTHKFVVLFIMRLPHCRDVGARYVFMPPRIYVSVGDREVTAPALCYA